MGQIVVTEFVSLDGVFEDPGDAEGFARAWPSVTDTVGFADKMNGMPKYVVSSTLTDPAWNNSAVIGLDDVPALKDRYPGGEGSGCSTGPP